MIVSYLHSEDKYGLVASNLLGNKHKELNAIYYRYTMKTNSLMSALNSYISLIMTLL